MDSAPAMDALPRNLKPGEALLVNGKLLTVKKVTEGTTDLFGEPTVQVLFTTGEVVAYRPDELPKGRVADEYPPRVYKCVECGQRRCARPKQVCEVCKDRAKAADEKPSVNKQGKVVVERNANYWAGALPRPAGAHRKQGGRTAVPGRQPSC